MPEESPKPITEKDLKLTPDEVEYLVKGAQKYLPPTDEDGDPIKETIDDKGN